MRDLQKEDRLAIFSLSAGHFISDAYSNFLGPLLPLLVLKLKLSIAQAGWLAAMQVISSSLTQPAYGYLSDRYLKRLFAVFSPLVTVVFMSFLGVAPNYLTLALLLLCGGVGIASFHPQSAALASSASRHRKGLGMSIFVTSGTIGYSLGPVIITSAVATFGLERSYWVMVPGVARLLPALLLRSYNAALDQGQRKCESEKGDKGGLVSASYPLPFSGYSFRPSSLFCELSASLLFSERGNTNNGRQDHDPFLVFWRGRRFLWRSQLQTG